MFIYLYLCQCYKSLKEVIKWTWLQVDPGAESRLLTPSFLECPFDIPTPELFQPQLSKVLWDHLAWMHDRTQGQGSMETLRFGWVSVEVYSLNTPAKLVCQFPSLLKLPPPSLEWSASFLGPFMPCVLEPVSGFTWETLKTVSQHEYLFTRWCLVFQATNNFALLIVYFWEQSS